MTKSLVGEPDAPFLAIVDKKSRDRQGVGEIPNTVSG